MTATAPTREQQGHVAAPAAPWRERDGGGRPRRRLHRLSAAVIVVGLAVTGALTAASRINYLDSEQSLTALETQLTADALNAAPLDLERRLAPAVAVATEARSPATAFRRMIGSSLLAEKGPFVLAALFRIEPGGPRLLAVVGGPPILVPGSRAALALVERAARAARTGALQVSWIRSGSKQRFAYAMAASGSRGTFVATAGETLPANRRITLPTSSPAHNLNIAIYDGRSTSRSRLIESTTRHLPLSGTVSQATVPFGSGVLTLVVSPRSSLAGTSSEYVAWGILVVGILLSLAIAAMTERLVRRRELAELLAGENRRLYQEQRGVAETLQHSLLPQQLPARPGLELAVRYLPGTAGIDVGGDWYDVVEIDADHVLFTVGDVAGHGLEAATLMSSLRNAIRAFALDGAGPAGVLTKLGLLLDVGRDGRFATVLCGLVDSRRGEVTLASADHPGPLLVRPEGSSFAESVLGPPVGAIQHLYGETTIRLEPGTTLLAFTDGLVERRDEALGVGLERLRRAASAEPGLEQLLDEIVAVLVPDGAPDDVALLGMRWDS